jgi:type I restriction enzyme S subunit
VTPTDVTALNGKFIEKSKESITKDGLQNSSAKLVPTGTVLLTSRATIGFTAITSVPVATNQGFANFICGSQIDPSYLALWLSSKRDLLISLAGGTTFKEISKGTLKNVLIPLPPLDEQRRIVDILDRAASIRRLRRQAQDTARLIIPALFNKMFGDPLANPRGWTAAPLGEVADVSSGVTKGRNLDGAETVEVPYLRVANVQDGHLNLTEVKQIPLRLSEMDRFRLLPGDLLMTEGGDPDKLGRGALWAGELPYCAHQNHVFRVRADDRAVLPHYLTTLTSSAYGKAYFLRVAKRTTGIASINKTQLSAFPVLLPPLALQREFERQVLRLERISQSQAMADAACDTAVAAVQARVFG